MLIIENTGVVNTRPKCCNSAIAEWNFALKSHHLYDSMALETSSRYLFILIIIMIMIMISF